MLVTTQNNNNNNNNKFIGSSRRHCLPTTNPKKPRKIDFDTTYITTQDPMGPKKKGKIKAMTLARGILCKGNTCEACGVTWRNNLQEFFDWFFSHDTWCVGIMENMEKRGIEFGKAKWPLLKVFHFSKGLSFAGFKIWLCNVTSKYTRKFLIGLYV